MKPVTITFYVKLGDKSGSEKVPRKTDLLKQKHIQLIMDHLQFAVKECKFYDIEGNYYHKLRFFYKTCGKKLGCDIVVFIMF